MSSRKEETQMSINYAAIESHLKNLDTTQQEITISFDQAARIMGQPLPPLAYNNFAWWAAQDESRIPNDNAWHTHGWRVDAVDFTGQWVRFARVK